MSIKVYNKLSPYIKEESHNPRKFKTYLLHFLHTHYFYSIEEYFQYEISASYRLFASSLQWRLKIFCKRLTSVNLNKILVIMM
jgi:hypothetical protein